MNPSATSVISRALTSIIETDIQPSTQPDPAYTAARDAYLANGLPTNPAGAPHIYAVLMPYVSVNDSSPASTGWQPVTNADAVYATHQDALNVLAPVDNSNGPQTDYQFEEQVVTASGATVWFFITKPHYGIAIDVNGNITTATTTDAPWNPPANVLNELGITGVYANRAPEEAKPPFVVYQQVSAPREYTFKELAAVHALFQIKVVDLGPSSPTARNADERLDELLMDVPMALDAPWVWKGTRRESDLPELPILDQGTEFVQVGGNYRVTVTK